MLALWLSDTEEQAECLNYLALLFYEDKQLEAAEKAASRAIQLVPDGSVQFLVCQCHCIPGKVCSSNGETNGYRPFRGGPRDRVLFRFARRTGSGVLMGIVLFLRSFCQKE